MNLELGNTDPVVKFLSQSTKLRQQTEKPHIPRAVIPRKVPSMERHQGMDFSQNSCPLGWSKMSL